MGIEKIVPLIRKISKPSSRPVEIIQEIAKKSSSGLGNSRMTYNATNIDKLPSVFKPFLEGVEKPKVKLGLNSRDGSGVFGISISDGNKPVLKAAFGIDRTFGEAPLLQMRGVKFADGKKVGDVNGFFNPNLTLKTDTAELTNSVAKKGKLVTAKNITLADADGNLAQALQYKSTVPELLEEFALNDSINVKNYKTLSKGMKKFWAKDGKTNYDILDAKNLLMKMATKKAKPTEKSMTIAKDALVKRMGYNPEHLPLKVVDATSAEAMFDPFLGEIMVSKGFLAKANNADVVSLLSHEIKHMDDSVKLAKKIGIPKYKKLLCSIDKESESLFNTEFYSKMVKDCDVSTINFKTFDLVNDFTAKANLNKYSGAYYDFQYGNWYRKSIMEDRARNVEKHIDVWLNDAGKNVSSGVLPKGSHRGDAPITFLDEYYPKIESKLAKYGEKKNDVFDEKYQEAFQKLAPDLDALEQKLSAGLTADEYDKVVAQAGKLRESYGDELYEKILERISKTLA